MITLYGFAVSNYYNKIKLALMEKDVAFIEEAVRPSRDKALLRMSPLGKVPFIKTTEGYLSESQAILEYLEEAFPEHPLYPDDVFVRAKCRELIQHLELNVELVARRLYPEAVLGVALAEETKQEVKKQLALGLQGLSRLLILAPYAMGSRFTAADVTAWPHLQMVSQVTQKVYGKDMVAEFIPGIRNYMKAVEGRPYVRQVEEDRAAALTQFLRKKAP